MEALHDNTPLLRGWEVGLDEARKVYYKMDCWQTAGSFKIRGIGRLCRELQKEGRKGLVSSSGGNAGYAAAYAARHLGMEAVVVVPETTGEKSRQAIGGQGASIIVHGSVWDEADKKARDLAKEWDFGYVPPFDHEAIWEGHATLIDEVAAEMAPPEAVVVSVGGGGLLCGIYRGLERNNWRDVAVVAVETEGAASFHRALEAGRPVDIGEITSIAKTLGARRVAEEAVRGAKNFAVHSILVSDEQAIRACIRFAEDLRTIVEPSCGASLAAVYEEVSPLGDFESILVIVCGGVGTTAADLTRWQGEFRY